MKAFLFIFLMPILSSAQFATIKGVAPLSTGEKIQLRVYDDPISGKERIVAEYIIEADGIFEFKAHINRVQYAFLQVGRNCADLFLQRDKGLELSFIPPKRKKDKAEAFYERHFFIPRITGGSSAELNEQITAFNDSLDAFMEAIYPILVQRKSPKFVAEKLATFEGRVAWDFQGVEPFVKDHIKYSIASIEQTFLTDRKRLFNKYLKGVKSKYENPAYVDFVLQYFQGVVYRMAIVEKHEECKKLLNNRGGFAGLSNLLVEQNPELKETSLARLILISGMDELFGQKGFEDEKLIKALQGFGMYSSSSHLGNAARNIAAKHEILVPNSIAPEIVFATVDGIEKKLSDLQGSYVFLELTDATNPYCLRETNVIPSLKNEFKNVGFVTICIGNSQGEMEALQRKLNIDWEFGGIDLSDPVVDNYTIKSLPRFYIIDPKGKFYRIPALDPSRGARSELSALHEMLKAKGKKSVGK